MSLNKQSIQFCGKHFKILQVSVNINMYRKQISLKEYSLHRFEMLPSVKQ